MTKPGNGSSERRGQASGGAPRKPHKPFPFFPRSPRGVLVVSSALTVVCFVSHIVFLLLVDPWRVLDIAKEDALAFSTIPVFFGVVFALSALYNFTRIEDRSVVHVILLIFAVIFGSFSLHGLFGFVNHYLNLMVVSSYPR